MLNSSSNNTTSVNKQQFYNVETLVKNPKVQPIINHMKETIESKSTEDVKVTDILSSQIMQLAYVLEEMYSKFGMIQLIEDICGNIVKIMKYENLERYIYLPYQILPVKFKNTNKDRSVKDESILAAAEEENGQPGQRFESGNMQFDNVMSQITASKIQLTYQDLESQVDFTYLSNPDLESSYLIHKRMNQIYQQEYERRGLEMDPERKTTNALDALDEIEKQRFQKANIAPPIATAQELTKEELYAKHFEELKNTIQGFIKALGLVYKWFIERYPPLTVEDVIKLNEAFENEIEMYRPFFDDKYRLDHYKGAMLSFEKVENTSQKASKLSRVMCTRARDKDGNLKWRGLTKEQIDASYVWEINFWRNYINSKGWAWKYFYEVNAKHGERCKADRADDLSETLSHYA
jgi:hypothetical protein